MNEPKHIRFVEIGSSVSGRTRVWAVQPKDGSSLIGDIRWYGPWRCYGFNPSPGTVYERVCLRDFANFCEQRTIEHRQRARAGVSGPPQKEQDQ